MDGIFAGRAKKLMKKTMAGKENLGFGLAGVPRREHRSIPLGVPEHFGEVRKIGPVMLRFWPPMTWPAQDGSVRAAVANADFSEFSNRFAYVVREKLISLQRFR